MMLLTVRLSHINKVSRSFALKKLMFQQGLHFGPPLVQHLQAQSYETNCLLAKSPLAKVVVGLREMLVLKVGWVALFEVVDHGLLSGAIEIEEVIRVQRRVSELAASQHLEGEAAHSPNVILEGLALLGTQELGRVPVDCLPVNEVLLFPVDRGCLHHVDEQVALLIVQDGTRAQLVVALFVIVQVMDSQGDLLQVPPGQSLWEGPELLDQVSKAAVLVFVRDYVARPLHFNLGIDRQDVVVLIREVLIFLEQEQAHKFVLALPVGRPAFILQFDQAFLCCICCPVLGAPLLEDQIFRGNRCQLHYLLSRLWP